MSSGHDTAYLTDEVAGGREGYYSRATAAGEPPGLWHGRGATELGLAGKVDADLLEGIYSHLLDPRDPAAHDRATWGEAETFAAGHRRYQTADELYDKAVAREPQAGPERRAELRQGAEQAARQPVSFVDLTFSAPKSWSVAAVAFERASNLAYEAGDLWEAARWEELHRTMEDAMLVGARASLDYLEDHAGYGRVGDHAGEGGRWVDAHGWVAAQFLQHDSRDHDPQLHVHNAVLNRQLCADGQWRALDTMAIRNWKPGAGAVGERAAESYATARAGLRFETRPDGKARELMGVDPALMDQFSKRTHQIGPYHEQLMNEFRERFGREPALHERARLGDQATLATRKAKEHDGLSAGELMDRWVVETRLTVGQDLAATAHTVAAWTEQTRRPSGFSPLDVKAKALAEVGRERGVWHEADLTQAVDRALPAGLGCPPEMARVLLEGLTTEALGGAVPAREAMSTVDAPPELTLEGGGSVYERPGSRTWSTAEQVAGERLLRQAAVARGAGALSVEEAAQAITRYAESGVELSAGQQAALVGVLTSGAMMETISAPPGTGKSFLLGAINDAWTESGRQMFGLAATQVATEVLEGEGLTSRNITRWLAAQERLAEGRGLPEDQELALRRGAIVAVDEGSMTSWADLVAVQQVCDAAGAKLLAVGDPQQLGAVGPGGALADVAEHGLSYELSEVRRFKEEWERQASLDLREGKRSAVDEYSKHGRLVGGGSVEATERAAANAWLADTLEGKESLLLAASNEQAARLSTQLRSELVELGRVSPEGVPLGLQGTIAGVGDVVQARRNAWGLKGWEGNTAAPVNRKTYEVTGIRPDGGLTVAPIMAHTADGRTLGDPMQLPPQYVDKHMALGYSSTLHAAESRTVNTGHTLLGPGMDAAGALVGLTRGTDRNTGWAVTKPAPSRESVPGEVAGVKERTAEAVLLDLLERGEVERGALAEREQWERDSMSTASNGGQLIDGVAQLTRGRTSAALDRLAAEGVLDPGDRARLAADEAMWSVDSILRRAELAGHDPGAVLAAAVGAHGFEDARSVAQVLHSRLADALDGQLTPTVGSFTDLIPASTPEHWRPWLERHAAAADERRAVLGTELAMQRPQWAVEALGDVPDDPVGRLEWEDKAGLAGAYRELVGHEDPADALGDAPPAGLPEKNAMWRAGHAALGLPDAGPEQRAASEGLLRAQVAAFEREEAWAPAWVADELATVSLAEQRARETATVCGAKADAEADPGRAAVYRDEAQQAAAQLAELAQQRAGLEQADRDRARWSVANAVTKDKAESARDELAARGVDLGHPPDLTTTQEWVEAHRAERAEAEAARTEISEAEITDPELEELRAERDAVPVPTGSVAGLPETGVADIRDTSTVDAHEHADPEQRRRVPAMAETREKVERAQDAVSELTARETLDAWADEDESTVNVARYGDESVIDDGVDSSLSEPITEVDASVDTDSDYEPAFN